MTFGNDSTSTYLLILPGRIRDLPCRKKSDPDAKFAVVAHGDYGPKTETCVNNVPRAKKRAERFVTFLIQLRPELEPYMIHRGVERVCALAPGVEDFNTEEARQMVLYINSEPDPCNWDGSCKGNR